MTLQELLLAASVLAIKQRDYTIEHHLSYLADVSRQLDKLKFNIRCAQIGELAATEEAKQAKRNQHDLALYRQGYK